MCILYDVFMFVCRLFFHLSETTPAGVRRAVDDAVEVGIEMIVQSFGTSWKMEDNGTLYMAAMKREIAYARSKSIEVTLPALIAINLWTNRVVVRLGLPPYCSGTTNGIFPPAR